MKRESDHYSALVNMMVKPPPPAAPAPTKPKGWTI
jgi:hypothetical protein